MEKKITPMLVMMMMSIMIIAAVFAVQGVKLQNRVSGAEATFHSLQTDYFVNNTKVERESAPAGSDLNQQLAEIQNTPSELLRLKLVGVGKILTGIFVLLFGMIFSLFMMPFRFGWVLQRNQSK